MNPGETGMALNSRLRDHFLESARNTRVNVLSIGLGYTAVTVESGGAGIAYTYITGKTVCAMVPNDSDYEGKPADRLLEKIMSPEPVERSMALALINALNHSRTMTFPEDRGEPAFFREFGVTAGFRVAMVGHFGPIIRMLEEKGAEVAVADEHRGLGGADRLAEKLGDWADLLILTSTAILNNTAESILMTAGPRVRTVLLGPSTPMVPEVFDHLPVHMLAGTAALDAEGILKAVRHGKGTPALQKFGKKVYWTPLP